MRLGHVKIQDIHRLSLALVSLLCSSDHVCQLRSEVGWPLQMRLVQK
jgi:hypothetical protein